MMSSQVPSFGNIMSTSVAFAARGFGASSSDFTGAMLARGTIVIGKTALM
jgi:hypothetical protein